MERHTKWLPIRPQNPPAVGRSCAWTDCFAQASAAQALCRLSPLGQRTGCKMRPLYPAHPPKQFRCNKGGRDYCLPASADCACLWNPLQEPTITTFACKDTTEFALSRKRPLPSTGYTQRSPAGERSDGQITSRRGVGGAAAPPTFNRVSRLCRLRGLLILLAKSIPYKFGRPLVDRICFLEKVVLTTFSTR